MTRGNVRVEVFGSVMCPYCYQARNFLKRHGIAYSYREVWMLLGFKLPTKSFREMKARSGGVTTVPQIFVNGEYYGDEDTLSADEQAGRLGEIFGV